MTGDAAAGADATLRAVVQGFAVGGEFLSAAPYGQGLIHRSYCVTVNRGGALERCIVQRINTRVFPRPIELMENIDRVTAHLAGIAESTGRRALALIPALDGRSWHRDADGAWWRMYRYIEGTRTVEQIESAEQCFQVARAFGDFQRQLTTLPPPRLHDTIPGFHDTPKRIAALERAIAADVAGRVKLAGPEIDFIEARRDLARVLLNAGLPERVTHNDTKINNVLLDEKTGEAVCVIDLDTVMPGLALYDFGDMVRTATCAAPEDERDLEKVYARFDYFEALARGYLSSAGKFLMRDEKELLTAAGKLITFEQGVRFLWDFLEGDKYYPVSREAHNLDRCRAQFRLLESIEQQERQMNRVVDALV
ncbi:MAG TPA: aminoglycoside phosphotransferase family protein [Terracidiphilus sp.]|jgi:aminoglycoside phosphotransferase (APT) family kinase protein|nr:aminoglycoside phosphotransferase family protein [Terracidiphilus sp.]